MYEAFEVCNQLSIPILAFKYSKFPEDKKIREKLKKKFYCVSMCLIEVVEQILFIIGTTNDWNGNQHNIQI